MGEPPCDQLQTEMALDLLEGELAAELPAHMRAFARAHADGRRPPAAPVVTRLASTLDTARRAANDELVAERGLAILRLVVPLLIDSAPAVMALRAETPSWAGLQQLTIARDTVAQARFGCRAIDLLHRLNGVGPARELPPPGPSIDGWQVPGPALDQVAVHDVWQLVAARLAVTGHLRVDPSEPRTQPRAFSVEPRREVIVVVPRAVDSPAARFAVLHELGHAVVALGMAPGLPRVVDEAAASYVARFMEPPSFLPPRWPSELAVQARERRLALAAQLDRIERALPELSEVPSFAPPWGLWHDPGAQGAYVDAEAMADRIRAELGPNPPRGQLLRALIAERDRIDLDPRTRVWT